MDGNGRWARARGLPRGEGHRRGVEALRRAVRFAGRRGIRYLTLFSFSSENWSRPQDEIQGLFNLLRIFIRSDLAELNQQRRARPRDRRARLAAGRHPRPDRGGGRRDRAAIRGLQLVVAFNYGARDEIVRAARELAAARGRGEIAPGGDRPGAPSQRRSTRRAFPIPTSSSAPPASSGSAISCSGRPPMPSSSSCRCSGRISATSSSRRRCANTPSRERRYGGVVGA